jgi:hypothetical protein
VARGGALEPGWAPKAVPCEAAESVEGPAAEARPGSGPAAEDQEEVEEWVVPREEVPASVEVAEWAVGRGAREIPAAPLEPGVPLTGCFLFRW